METPHGIYAFKMQKAHLLWSVCLVVCLIFIFLFISKPNFVAQSVVNTAKETGQPTNTDTAYPHPDPNCSGMLDVLHFLSILHTKERRVYSQNNEDGIIEALLEKIGGPKWKYYVEFGVSNGLECNTRHLRDNLAWQGLWMDNVHERPAINWHKEEVYYHNVVALLQKYNVPKQFDILSEDTDFKDYWNVQAILAAGYRPRIIVVEINSFKGPVESVTVPKESDVQFWKDGTQYYGFSVAAAWKLARQFNYSLVYCETKGVNCFMVIDGINGFGEGVRVSDYLSGFQLWRPPNGLSHREDTQKRPFVNV